jgi:hypothetical protein
MRPLDSGVVPKVVRGTETSCNLLKHRTPINRAKLGDMKVKKVLNLLTTDQKVGGSSPSKRTETQEAFTTSRVSSFLGLKAPASKRDVETIGWP